MGAKFLTEPPKGSAMGAQPGEKPPGGALFLLHKAKTGVTDMKILKGNLVSHRRSASSRSSKHGCLVLHDDAASKA